MTWDNNLKIHFIHDVSHPLACRQLHWVVYRADGSVVGVYVWSRYRIAGFRNFGMESVCGRVKTKKVKRGGEKQQVETGRRKSGLIFRSHWCYLRENSHIKPHTHTCLSLWGPLLILCILHYINLKLNPQSFIKHFLTLRGPDKMSPYPENVRTLLVQCIFWSSLCVKYKNTHTNTSL